MSQVYTFKRTQMLTAPIAETFRFFTEFYNVRQVTPSFVNLDIQSPYPVRIQKNRSFQFSVAPVWPLSFNCEHQVTQFNPSRMFFEEEQVKGPYKSWRHAHSFKAATNEITEVSDEIRYSLPFGPLNPLVNLLVKRKLKQVFDYRFQRLVELFRPPIPPRDHRHGPRGKHGRKHHRRR